jgi:hypothetical protein
MVQPSQVQTSEGDLAGLLNQISKAMFPVRQAGDRGRGFFGR